MGQLMRATMHLSAQTLPHALLSRHGQGCLCKSGGGRFEGTCLTFISTLISAFISMLILTFISAFISAFSLHRSENDI